MFTFPFFGKRSDKKPHVLVVLDGFGSAPPSQGNAVTLAKTPNYDRLLSSYPHAELIASGESVGLPANEVGNTEVGHLTLGAGRTILQDLKRINQSIEDGTFYENKAMLDASNHAKKNGSAFHIMGMVSTGNVHSSMLHFNALLQFAKKEGLQKVNLHLFTDGRDAPPKEGIEVIEKIESQLRITGVGRIASISGRYYAMDRDRRWERTEKVYKAIVLGQAIQVMSAKEAMESAYARGQTDEFVEPTLIADSKGPIGLINDNDSIVFFNYRIDRPKQLTMAFVIPNFENLGSYDFGTNPQNNKDEKGIKVGTTFNREKILKNIYFVTMTEYMENLPVQGIGFAPEKVSEPLGEVISKAGLAQLHMAESEKERFVTYYFNGMREERFAGEEVRIIASPKVATYDRKPEMSLPKLVGQFKKEIRSGKYDFAVINFANADMVAHSGNLQASIRAVEYVDRYLKDLTDAVLNLDGTVYITADHGNAEELITFPGAAFFITTSKGSVNTDHSNNPVPFLVLNKRFYGKPVVLPKGALSDVAPTILAMMGIRKPDVMTGRNLLAMDNEKKQDSGNMIHES